MLYFVCLTGLGEKLCGSDAENCFLECLQDVKSDGLCTLCMSDLARCQYEVRIDLFYFVPHSVTILECCSSLLEESKWFKHKMFNFGSYMRLNLPCLGEAVADVLSDFPITTMDSIKIHHVGDFLAGVIAFSYCGMMSLRCSLPDINIRSPVIIQRLPFLYSPTITNPDALRFTGGNGITFMWTKIQNLTRQETGHLSSFPWISEHFGEKMTERITATVPSLSIRMKATLFGELLRFCCIVTVTTKSGVEANRGIITGGDLEQNGQIFGSEFDDIFILNGMFQKFTLNSYLSTI